MIHESIYGYITGPFYTCCKRKQITFPILLYVDGHKSHLTLTLSDFCAEHDIELRALYANAINLLQPMDVTVFLPVKINWFKAGLNWRIESDDISIDKMNFAHIMKKAIEMLNLVNILRIISFSNQCSLLFEIDECQKYMDLDLVEQSVEQDDNSYSHRQFLENLICAETSEKFKASQFSEVWEGDDHNRNLFYLWCKVCTAKRNVVLSNEGDIPDHVVH